MAFSSDGAEALAGRGDGSLGLWNLESGREIRPFESHGGSIRTVAWRPGGGAVMAAGSARFNLYDLRTGRIAERLVGVSGGVSTAAFLPDGRRVLLACYNASVQLWRLRDHLVAER